MLQETVTQRRRASPTYCTHSGIENCVMYSSGMIGMFYRSIDHGMERTDRRGEERGGGREEGVRRRGGHLP